MVTILPKRTHFSVLKRYIFLRRDCQKLLSKADGRLLKAILAKNPLIDIRSVPRLMSQTHTVQMIIKAFQKLNCHWSDEEVALARKLEVIYPEKVIYTHKLIPGKTLNQIKKKVARIRKIRKKNAREKLKRR